MRSGDIQAMMNSLKAITMKKWKVHAKHQDIKICVSKKSAKTSFVNHLYQAVSLYLIFCHVMLFIWSTFSASKKSILLNFLGRRKLLISIYITISNFWHQKNVQKPCDIWVHNPHIFEKFWFFEFFL